MSAALEHVSVRALAPLDRARALWLRAFGRWMSRLLRVRSERVALQAGILASTSLALALYAPLWLLTLGPLVLGVPHLVSDVRYLVVRQGLVQRRLWCAVVAPCLIGASLAPGRGWGIAAVACSALLARGAYLRRMLAAVSCFVVWRWAQASGPKADVIFAHAHNLVAIGCWAAWARGTRLQLAPALAVCCLGSWLVLSGVTDDLIFRHFALSAGRFAIDAGSLVVGLAPTDDPLWAWRWTICFAFMQSVHYGVWLRSLPDEDRARPGLRTLQSSYRALARDVGPWLVAAAVLMVPALWASPLANAASSLGRAPCRERVSAFV